MTHNLSDAERGTQAVISVRLCAFARNFRPVSLPGLIRSMRKRRGLTQVQLAAIMGVSKGAVAQWELDAGGTTPSVENMARLRDVLEIGASADSATGVPNSYQFVEDVEKLAWLRLFDLMSEAERLVVARMIRGAVTVKTGTVTSGQNADPP